MGLSRNSTFPVNPRFMLVVGGFESQTRCIQRQRVEAEQRGGQRGQRGGQCVEADQGGG